MLTGTFVAFMVLATLLAAIGVVTDSPITIVGAMVVGPEFGPLAALAVSLVRRRPAPGPPRRCGPARRLPGRDPGRRVCWPC